MRKKLSAFFLRNWNKGIPNLMLYIAVGNLFVFLLSFIDQSGMALAVLRFDRDLILQGQVWRLFTTPFLHLAGTGNSLLAAIFMFSYVWIGRYAEQFWGTCKFTVYYLLGLALHDITALIGGFSFTPNAFHMTLFLLFAIAVPNAQVRLWGIIPLRAKYLAWFQVISTALSLFDAFSMRALFPSLIAYGAYLLMQVLPLAYFLLFVGSDAKLLLPDRFTKTKTQKNFRNFQNQQRARTRQYGDPNWSDSYRSASGEKPYRHKCTVCGRTDVSNPELEFRYCSKCNGYYCYCMDHISNHAHIQ